MLFIALPNSDPNNCSIAENASNPRHSPLDRPGEAARCEAVQNLFWPFIIFELAPLRFEPFALRRTMPDDPHLACDVTTGDRHQRNCSQQRNQAELKPAALRLLGFSGVEEVGHIAIITAGGPPDPNDASYSTRLPTHRRSTHARSGRCRFADSC